MKLGPHIILRNAPGLAWGQRAPIVKTMDPSVLAQLPAGTTTIYRRYYSPQDQLDRLGDPLNGYYVANEIAMALRATSVQPTYVEVFNEVAQSLDHNLPEYVAFLQHAVWRLHELGYRVAGFSFGTGQLEEDDVQYLRQREWCGVDVLALHAYWGNEGLTKWNALRYRLIHEWSQGQHPPIVISECGRDAVEGSPGGWHAGGVSDEQYVAELMAYDAAISEDDYVLGAAVFTSGATPDWRDYETDSISDRLTSSGQEGTGMRSYVWAPGAEDAAASRQLNKAFGPAVVTSTYDDLYKGLEQDSQPVDAALYGKAEGDILRVEQLVGVEGEDRPRGTLVYLDTGPGDGWDGWGLVPFE